MRHRHAPLILVCCLVLLTACTARRSPEPPQPPPPAEGRSSFDFMLNTPDLDTEPPRDQELRAPMLREEPPLPVYPATALAAGAGPATVALRLRLDREGRIAEVGQSPRLPSTPGPYAADFRRAAEEALAGWSFAPAIWRQFEPGEDLDGDGVVDYRRMIESRAVEFYLDIRFDFEIVDGRGTVSTDQSVD
jgi:hypothetical protein